MSLYYTEWTSELMEIRFDKIIFGLNGSTCCFYDCISVFELFSISDSIVLGLQMSFINISYYQNTFQNLFPENNRFCNSNRYT